MTTLTGTPKQTAWANDIRTKMMSEIEKQFSGLAAQKVIGCEDAKSAMLTWFARQSDSKFWIDNRELLSRRLMKLAVDSDETVRAAWMAQHQ